MIDEDLAFEILAGDWVFQLNEQGFIWTVTVLMVKEWFKQLNAIWFLVMSQEIIDSDLEFLFEDFHFSFISDFIWESL